MAQNTDAWPYNANDTLIGQAGGPDSLVGNGLFERLAEIGGSLSLAVAYASKGYDWALEARGNRNGTREGAATWLQDMSDILARAGRTLNDGSEQHQSLCRLSWECGEASRCTASGVGPLNAEGLRDVAKRFLDLEGDLSSKLKQHAQSIAWGILSDDAFSNAFLSKQDIWWNRWDDTIQSFANSAIMDPEAANSLLQTVDIDEQRLERRFNRIG